MWLCRNSAVLLVLSCHVIEGAHILALFSSLSFSDHLVFHGYVSLLAKQHSVVVMTAYPEQFPYSNPEKVVELDVGKESAPFWDEFKMLATNTDDYYQRLRAKDEHSLKLAIAQLKSKQMTALFVNPNIKFDLVITEADVPLLYAVADKYEAPHIAITTSSGKIHQYEAKGVPVNPTLYPDVNSLYYGNLSTWQKTVELRRHIQSRNEYYNNYLPMSDFAAKKILGLKRDLLEVEKDIDMLFVANSPMLIGNRPFVPAVTFVDRMHIEPGFTLPKDLQEKLDSASNGVIYFSLGAVQESEQLAPHMLKTLTEAFNELPFTILWKIENVTAINKPANVITSSWFPQQEILAHPNVKAFITHGGARSLEEAVFYQVPIVGLPLVQSRKLFIREVTKHGAGEILDSYKLDKETIKTVVKKVVTEQNYLESMRKLRGAVVDPIISGPENAALWTDYVLKNGGAHHLRSPAAGSAFISYYTLNLIIVLFLLLLAVIYLIYALARFCLRCLVKFLRKRKENAGGKFKLL